MKIAIHCKQEIDGLLLHPLWNVFKLEDTGTGYLVEFIDSLPDRFYPHERVKSIEILCENKN